MSKATKGCAATTLDVLSRWRRPRPEQHLYLKQAELIWTLWQPLLKPCRILSDLPYHYKASKQTCVYSKKKTKKQKTKNRKSLSARSNFACSQLDRCSSTKRHFCVLCCVVEGVVVVSEYTVGEAFILTFVSLTSHWQVTLSRSALCSGETEVKMCGFRGVVTIHLAAYFSILWLVSGLRCKT